MAFFVSTTYHFPLKKERVSQGDKNMSFIMDSINRRYGTYRGWIRLALARIEARLGRIDPFLQWDPSRVKRLVFVCLGNINRSAYGHIYTRSLTDFPIVSMGLSTTTGAPATDQARHEAMARGQSLETHTATDMSDYRWQEGDLLLAMEIRHAHKLREAYGDHADILLLGALTHNRYIHLHDPHTLSDGYFTTCFGRIEEACRRLVSKLPK
jgi:protein-tyrosine phosphatase